MATTTAAAAAHPMHGPGPVEGPGEAFLHTIELCLGPAVFMLVMSFAVFCRKPSQTFVSMMQHFGAGIVLSAVATELLPAMSSQAHTKHRAASTLATLIGFFTGVAMMVSVAHFCGEPEMDEEEEEEQQQQQQGDEATVGTGGDAGSHEQQLAAGGRIRSPDRRMRKAITVSGATDGTPGTPRMLQRNMTSRRRTLMETYRQAAQESSSPISIGLGRTARQQQQQHAEGHSLSRSVPISGGVHLRTNGSAEAAAAAAPTETTGLLRKSLTTSGAGTAAGSRSSLAAGDGEGNGSLGSAAAEARRRQLREKYDSDEETGSGGIGDPALLRRRSSSGASSGGAGGGAMAVPLVAASTGAAVAAPSYGPIPWTLIVPVYVDSFMDGLLIGLSAVAGKSAGIVMSVALTIEMGFLGLTFSAGVSKVRPALRNLLVTGAPLMILVGGSVGALAAAALSANPIFQVGLIAFGVAALLYLVTEELLVEAHEGGEPHQWYVDSLFFVGFIASVLLEQAIQDGEASTAAGAA